MHLERLAATVCSDLFNSDPIATHHLKPHAGKTIEICITDWATVKALILSSGELVAPHHSPVTPHLCLKGASKDFIALINEAPGAALQIQGDVSLSKAFSSAIDGLEVDWVSFLTPWLGATLSAALAPTLPIDTLKTRAGDLIEDACALKNTIFNKWVRS